jgi:hypothetical protein
MTEKTEEAVSGLQVENCYTTILYAIRGIKTIADIKAHKQLTLDDIRMPMKKLDAWV